jgi:hypothetical protein
MSTQRTSTIAKGAVDLQDEHNIGDENFVKSTNELLNITSESHMATRSIMKDFPLVSDGHIFNLFCQVSSPMSFQTVLRSTKHRFSESRDFTSHPSNHQLDDEVARNTTSLKVIERETDVEIRSHLYLIQRAWKLSKGNPNPIIGSGTAFDALNFLPIEQTMRNAELLYFCKASLFIQIIITLIIAISSPITGSFICHNRW